MSDQNIVIDRDEGTTTITPEQQRNLRMLANHLLTLAPDYPDFAMRLFVNDNGKGFGWHRAYRAECGTAACAVGHGPIAGIAPVAGETWSTYSNRCFVPERIWQGEEDGDGEPWEWCFGADWAEIDNTAHGAAHRINWLLDNRGIPDDAQDQREGDAPISYWPEPAAPLLA